MLSIGVSRREERDKQVYRLVIQRVERNRRVQAHNDRADAVQAVQPGVRDRDALANSGGAGCFTLDKALQGGLGIHAKNAAGHIRNHRKRLALAGRASA